jgi:hypothetical protein
MKLKYNKEEFEQKAKELSETHDVPLDVMREWLREAYNKLLKQYIVSKKGKKPITTKEETKTFLEDTVDKSIEWICPFCGSINSNRECSGCDAYMDDTE